MKNHFVTLLFTFSKLLYQDQTKSKFHSLWSQNWIWYKLCNWLKYFQHNYSLFLDRKWQINLSGNIYNYCFGYILTVILFYVKFKHSSYNITTIQTLRSWLECFSSEVLYIFTYVYNIRKDIAIWSNQYNKARFFI